MLDEGVFRSFISRVAKIRQGETRGGRFMTPYLEGLVRVLARITFVLSDQPDAVALCQDHNLAFVFTELLQANGLDSVQMVSAMALENLSQESKHLTKLPQSESPGSCASMFPCFSKSHIIAGLCQVHRGKCSLQESFCLLDGKALDKLVANLDHANEKVVEASLAAMSTLLDDIDIVNGVNALCEVEAIKPIFDVFLENYTATLRRRAVWIVERLLREMI